MRQLVAEDRNRSRNAATDGARERRADREAVGAIGVCIEMLCRLESTVLVN